jgi:phosphate transport system permease protein
MFGLCALFAVLIVVILGWVLQYLVRLGAAGLTWDFFTRVPTGDVTDPGGMKHAVVGTLVLVALASVVGVPMGMLAGVYLSEYRNETWLATPTRFIADVLAGVPSIVVGILGYELLVVPLGRYNGWAGALALAFIMVPIVARTTEEMLRLVPQAYREGSLALGATKSQTILRVVLPSATGSIITGIMLALARIAGETAPLLFTALGSRFLTLDPNQPFPSLTVQIFTYATGPYKSQQELAWAGILVLVAMLFVINLTVRFIAARTMRSVSG